MYINLLESYMKNKKLKNFFKIKLLVLVWIASLWSVYAADYLSSTISSQSSSGVWSNNSDISVIAWEEPGYWNDGNNSTIIWNYFRGYYYDSIFWFFELDWSTDPSENVSIIWSTSACGSSYGYKLWWYAYSEYFGFMDFDYSDSIFVYYCEWDKVLHWYSYSKNLWFQNFEGIAFEIVSSVSTLAENTSTGIFVNDTTNINIDEFWSWNLNSRVWADLIQLEDDKESIFYIIK